jgi:hypothetical protein
MLVGRKNFILSNASQKKYGQYEIETLIENRFSEVKKAAVVFRKDILFIFVELFDTESLIQTEITAFITSELLKLEFQNIQFKFIKKMPYDSRHQWKVLYHKL